MAKVSVQGGFHLLWGLAVSAVISAIGIIIFARVPGPTEYGLYAIALIAPNRIVPRLGNQIGNDQVHSTVQRGKQTPKHKKHSGRCARGARDKKTLHRHSRMGVISQNTPFLSHSSRSTYAILTQLNLSSWVNLIKGLALFLLIFLPSSADTGD